MWLWNPPGWWREYFVMTVAFVPIIAAAAAADAAGRSGWLAGRTMETLGRWSFALYLVHFPVLLGFQRAGAHGVVGAAAALIVAIALSGVLHACFERPVERWLRGSWGLAPSRGRPGVATDPASAA